MDDEVRQGPRPALGGVGVDGLRNVHPARLTNPIASRHKRSGHVIAYARRGRGPRDRPRAGWRASCRSSSRSRAGRQRHLNPEIATGRFIAQAPSRCTFHTPTASSASPTRTELATAITTRESALRRPPRSMTGDYRNDLPTSLRYRPASGVEESYVRFQKSSPSSTSMGYEKPIEERLERLRTRTERTSGAI